MHGLRLGPRHQQLAALVGVEGRAQRSEALAGAERPAEGRRVGRRAVAHVHGCRAGSSALVLHRPHGLQIQLEVARLLLPEVAPVLAGVVRE
eukprot:CAMPEP_0115667530 /NCGR_PEP_ID=MMETSP0272-20121206/49992_1 /TAXON_ID=71861 /ORGANISM="Scrippsiella trochoidea, Strain CCMP3099" /LENGTH=91 /DNA_ID=CAMNT_0003106089 /DNA_START=272 /DNA_END=547 /DNA_ORIENTATION=-